MGISQKFCIRVLRLVFTSDGIVIRSIKQRSRKKNTHAAYDTVAYDLVKIKLSESDAEAEE